MIKINNKSRYLISENGNIMSYLAYKVLTPYKNKQNGYLQIRLGRGKMFYVHRLVAEAYIINDKKLKCINHIDGNKLNNHYTNLEWCTHKENSIHALKNNLIKIPPTLYGESNGNAKLTNKQRDDIIIEYKNTTQKKLGEKYNVTRQAIGYILKTWRKHK